MMPLIRTLISCSIVSTCNLQNMFQAHTGLFGCIAQFEGYKNDADKHERDTRHENRREHTKAIKRSASIFERVRTVTDRPQRHDKQDTRRRVNQRYLFFFYFTINKKLLINDFTRATPAGWALPPALQLPASPARRGGLSAGARHRLPSPSAGRPVCRLSFLQSCCLLRQ